MKKYITRHIIPLCLLFLLLASCNRQEDTPQQADGMVNLTISAAMASRAEDTGDENRTYNELMHTLRIIIFDEAGNVEGNRLYEFEGGVFHTESHIFIVKGNETKTIYLLANCEDILENKEISISNLDKLELTTDDDWFSTKSKDTDFHLPATAKYNIYVGNENQTETLYVAHAANKICFSFTNETGGDITISEWQLGSTADKSYLIPHIVDDDKEELKWYEKIQDEAHPAVTNYEVPSDVEYNYLGETGLWIEIPNNETKYLYGNTEGTPYYFHESKFLNKSITEDTGEEQIYNISFVINGVRHYAVLEDLPSLFRGTYVQIKVTIYPLGAETELKGIYAEIQPWEKYPPTTGTIKPEEEEEETTNSNS